MSVRSPAGILLISWLGLVLGVIIFMSSTFSLFLEPIAQEFGWRRSQLSLAYSLFSLTSTLALPAIGRLVDRIGAKQVIVACTLAFVVISWLLRSVTGLWQFYTLFVLAGVVSGGTSTLAYFKVLVRTFGRHRGLALGIANSGTAIGTVLFPLIAYRLNESFGWRNTYALVGTAIAVIIVPTVAVGLATGPPGEQADLPAAIDSPTGGGFTLPEAMRTARFWIIGITFFTVTTALVGYLIHLVPLLKDRGIETQTASMAASLFGGAQLLGRLGAGLALDHLGAGKVAAGLWLLAAVALGAVAAGVSGGTLLVCTAAVGLAFGGEGDVLAYFVSRLFGQGSFGRIYSVLLMINLSGAVVGPYLFGVVFDAMGSYVPVLAATAGTTVLAALVMTVQFRRNE